MTGATLGTWVLGPELGRGPVGTVYRATDAHDPSRTAAVKVLTADTTRRPEFLLRFPGEMLPLLRLRHPNVARVFDSGVHAGTAYYASELIDGSDLGSLLKTAGRPDPGLSWRERVLSLAVQAARGLKYGHHRSQLHRDLKPANVLVAADGTVKLTDYGVAKVLNLSPLVLPADPFGTAGFLAPEVFTGKPLTRRSDLYSLGCLLYAAVTGRPPYTAATPAEFMHKHCYVLPDRPMQFAPKLPAELDELICSLLQKDPARRPPTAAAVLEVLTHIRGKAERKGEVVVWPAGGEADVVTPVDDEAADAGDDVGRPRPWLSRPAVVVPLFLLVVGAAAALFFRPRPTAEELFARARPLVESDDPTLWQQAMDEYLTPLSERFPDRYADEIRAARVKLTDRRRLSRAIEDGRKVRPQSEAERLYNRGLTLAQAGDAAGARRVWAGVSKLFADADPDRRWVQLAAAGVAEIDKLGPAEDGFRTLGVTAVIDRAKLLPPADADALYDALEQTYVDDPPARDLIRKARGR